MCPLAKSLSFEIKLSLQNKVFTSILNLSVEVKFVPLDINIAHCELKFVSQSSACLVFQRESRLFPLNPET